jgi:opacity protein-like surface antigen
MTSKTKTMVLAMGLALAATTAQAQSFEGAYAGGYVTTNLNAGFGTYWGVGVQAGYNFSVGTDTYLGVEVDGGAVFAAPTTYLGTVSGRAGFAVSNDVLLYGSLGGGISGTSLFYWQAGAGAEYNVTESVYLRAGVDRLAPVSAGAALYLGKFGVGYRF